MARRRRQLATILTLGWSWACFSTGPDRPTPVTTASPAPPPTSSPDAQTRRERLLADATAGLVFTAGRLELPATSASPAEPGKGVPSARQLLAAGRPYAAITAARRAFLTAPGPDTLLPLAEALAVAGAAERSLAAYATLLALEPGSLAAGLGAAAALEGLGRPHEAIEILQATARRHPEHATVHARLAIVAYRGGRAELARPHRDRARALGGRVPALVDLRLDGKAPPRLAVTGGGILVGPEVRVDDGGSAGTNETSVAADADALRVLVGWNDDRVPGEIDLGVGRSSDGGVTWSEGLLAVPAEVETGLVGDPMTAFDPRTGDLFIGGIVFAEEVAQSSAVVAARWANGVAELGPTVAAFVDDGFVDKCWMAAGTPPGDPDATRLYIAFSQGLLASTDLGATWSPPVPLGSDNAYLPRVGPAGELFVSSRTIPAPRDILLRRSFDGGASFASPVTVATITSPGLGDVIPGVMRIANFPSFAFDPRDGRLALVYDDDSGGGDVDLYLTFSGDGGATWSVPAALDVPGDAGSDHFMPWIEADANGGLHLLWLDTRFTAQDDSDSEAFIDVVYAYSADRGASWSEARLTPASFSSADSGFQFQAQFLGDYLGFAVAAPKVAVAYPSTAAGDTDIFFRSLSVPEGIFADGFESGDTTAW